MKKILRDASGKVVTTKKYAIIYGNSVYYPYQDDYTFVKEFNDKKKAGAFLKKANKKYDFTEWVSKNKLKEVV